MLGIADVKPVAEQDTDQSDASKIVPVTQSELDFKQLGGEDSEVLASTSSGLSLEPLLSKLCLCIKKEKSLEMSHASLLVRREGVLKSRLLLA